MHRVHLSLPFLFWGAFIPSALAAPAPSSFLPIASPSTYSVSPFSSQLEVTLGPLENPTGGSSPYLKDSSALLRKSSVSPSPEAASHGAHKTVELKRLARKLRMSFWLLLFVGAGVVSLTLSRVCPPAPLKKEEEKEEKEKEPIKPVPVAEPPVSSPVERLEKVRDLLPAAIRLANVVDTPEAASCINSLSECLKAKAPQVRDKVAVEASLNTALAALQRLHRGAMEQAKLLVLEDEARRLIPVVHRWEAELKEAQIILKGPGVQESFAPFLRTLNSLQGNIENLTKRIDETEGRMRSQKTFENENDGAALLSVAADLQQLRVSIGARRSAVRLAAHARSCAVETAKTLVVGQRELDMWNLDEKLGALCFKAALVKARLERKEESGLPLDDLSAAEDVKSELNKLQKDLGVVLEITGRLHLLAINMQTAGSLEAAEFLNSDLLRHQQEAADVLRRGAAIAARLPSLEEPIDSKDMEVAAHTAQWLEKCFNSDTEGLLGALQQAEEWVNFLKDGVYAGNVWLGDSLVEDQKSQVASIKATASQREEAVASSLSRLKESRQLSEALSLMKEANEKFKGQTKDRVALQVIAQHAFFMQMIQDDLVYAVVEARRTADYKEIPEKTAEKKQYEDLQEQFNRAQQALKEAKTLEDAADAAAGVRAVALQMQDLLFTSDLAGGP